MRKESIVNSLTTFVYRINPREYKVYFNIVPDFEMEKVFKNSAFVETGKKILTGYSTANYLVLKSSLKPTLSQVLDKIYEEIDKYTDSKIKCGFVWKGYKVWLSKENQMNYASWLLAAQDNPSIFPLCAKFVKESDRKSVIYNFSSYEELKDFYGKMIKFVSDCVNENRKIKDNVNPDLYKENLKAL